MKLLLRTMLASALCCSFVHGADAQTGGTAAGVATGTADRPWSFSFGATGSYEGNALFVGPEENQEFAHQFQATIGHNWLSRRGSASLGASASQSFYNESTVLNDFRYSFAGGLSYALTRRLSWVASSTFTSGLARDAEVLTQAGLVLPTVSARTSNSASTFSYLLTPKSQLSWSLSQQGVGFSSGLFNGGTTVASILNWSRQVFRAQSLGVTQEYSRTFSGDTSSNIYGLLGTWTASPGAGWTAFASAGIRPFTIPGETGLRMSTGISAGLNKPVRPGQSFGISYNKAIEQSFGLDRTNHLVQTVSGNYELVLRRNLSSSFGGSYSRGTSPTTPDLVILGDTLHASLAYQMTTNLSLSVGFSVYGRTDPPAEGVTSSRTYVSLTYGTTWR